MELEPVKEEKVTPTAIIALALVECKKLGINKVLMYCCSKDNIGSAKSNINNGGILENEIEEDRDILSSIIGFSYRVER